MIYKHSILISLLFSTCPAWAFDSGSDGSDGALNPTISTEIPAKVDGIYNYSSISIPLGVTVTFQKNAANTPITLLASGDVTIDGIIDLGGTKSTNVGANGDGNIGDDGLPGLGGPGGFDGGTGGQPGAVIGSGGMGPGGGGPARAMIPSSTWANYGCGGAGGAFGANGGGAGTSNTNGSYCHANIRALTKAAYGSPELLPLIGGSGGGGASSGLNFGGSGGGGGGGALLIAASGTVTVSSSGTIKANGGTSGSSSGPFSGGSGGGGAGGAIRIVATTIAGNGSITATGGSRGAVPSGSSNLFMIGGTGAVGRIRLEAENILRTSNTSPSYAPSSPQDVFLAGLPSLRIVSIAGQAAPLVPTGNADITLLSTEPNPVTVAFETSGVPVGNTVKLTVIPQAGVEVIAPISTALAGTEANATATTSVDLPDGPSVLLAEVSYQVTVAMGNQLSIFTDGEQVASVTLKHDAVNGPTTTFVTVSGREVSLPSYLAAMPG